MPSKRLKLVLSDSEAPERVSKSKTVSLLARSASRLDDLELDRLFTMALRGDHDEVVAQLDKMGITDCEIRTPQWSETSSWIFKRTSEKK